MIIWLVSIVAGPLLAALAYRVRPAARAWPVFALRAFAGTLVVALLLDAALGPSTPVKPWVGLDVSASWRASGDPDAWRTALAVVDSLERAGADSVLLFGDSVRSDSAPGVPVDRATRVGPLTEAAMALGRPLVLVTDGAIDDPERTVQMLRGSAVRLVVPVARPDAAIAVLDAPGGALGGDTVRVRVVVKAGAAGSAAASLEVALDSRPVSTTALPALEPYEEREVRVEMPVPASDATRRIRASLSKGDAVAENDTVSAPLVVSGAAAATFISTAPDQDARFALSVLRGTRRGPVQGFWRVAPGQWRVDGSLRPVTEAVVRQAAGSAPLLVIHGDTAIFGAPRSLSRAAVVLIAPPAVGDDYYPTGTGDSPLSAALGGVPWDSLAPLDVAPMGTGPRTATMSTGASAARASATGRDFPAVMARRARRFEERAVVTLEDGARRAAVVPAAGLWRWRLRGGRSADAFDAVWGSIFDWVGAEPRSAAPVAAQVAARSSGAGEWVPRRATVVNGAVGDGAPLDRAPRALGAWWLAGLAIAALCAEWLLRRRIGLR